MTIKDFIGGASAASLGYITGNTKGAINWYRLYHEHSNRPMPPVRTPKRRTRVLPPYFPTPRSKSSLRPNPLRRDSQSSYQRRLSALTSARVNFSTTNNNGYRGVTAGNASFVKKKKNGKMSKKRKPAKVSQKFRKKVRASLEDHLTGKYLKVHWALMGPPSSFTQSVFDFGFFFTPIRFIEAAGVMFNKDTPVEFPAQSDINWTNSYIRKDFIVNSYVTIELKNMSQRTYTITMYNCAPKTKGTSHAPLTTWSQGLITATNNKTNPESNVTTTLFNDPRQDPTFNYAYKVETTKIVLQPGQTNLFTVQGPSQLSVDWSKMFERNASVDSIRPFALWSRGVFFTYYEDLVNTANGQTGRIASTGVGIGGLSAEYKEFFTMQCPASAGFTYPASTAAGVQQQLDNKIPTRIIKLFPPIISGNVEDVLEENPITVVNPVD